MWNLYKGEWKKMNDEDKKEIVKILDIGFQEALSRFPRGRFSSNADNNMALSLLQVFYHSVKENLDLD